ncbi:MAG: hypothetical protein IPH39_08165 [Sulfuritalea sp.]|nr:hypothetical protein [Sulfuritalea sp.]
MPAITRNKCRPQLPAKPTPGMQQMQARMAAMQARMAAMQKSTDPQARMPMMMEQMQDMQAMMKDMHGACPMARLARAACRWEEIVRMG